MIKVLRSETADNERDTVTFDIPLFIRLLEYSREEAPGDAALHKLTENVLRVAQSGVSVLGMDNYQQLLEGIPQKEESGLSDLFKKLIANLLLAMGTGLYPKFSIERDRLCWVRRGDNIKRNVPFDKDVDIPKAATYVLNDVLNTIGYEASLDTEQRQLLQLMRPMSFEDIARKWPALTPIVTKGAELLGSPIQQAAKKLTLVRKSK